MTIVGRRISIGDGRLDLLAIDSMDRGLVVEIKPGILGTGALTQALAYASSIARLDAERISEKLDSNLAGLGDKDKLSAAVKRQLDSEQETGGKREIAVLLVGVGIAAGLERVMEFLDGFGVPINAVSFEVFELDGGPKLPVRERIDERAGPLGRQLRSHSRGCYECSRDCVRLRSGARRTRTSAARQMTSVWQRICPRVSKRRRRSRPAAQTWAPAARRGRMEAPPRIAR